MSIPLKVRAYLAQRHLAKVRKKYLEAYRMHEKSGAR